MGERTAAVALALGLAVGALPACSDGGPAQSAPTTSASAPATASPTAIPHTAPTGRVHPKFVAKTACKAITEPELRIVLGVKEVERPAEPGGDRTACFFIAAPMAKDSPAVSVRLFPSAQEYHAALAKSSGRPTHVTEDFGDGAFFDDLTLYVLAGNRSFLVFASTEQDIDKTSLDLAGRTVERYRDVARRAAEVLVFRV